MREEAIVWLDAALARVFVQCYSCRNFDRSGVSRENLCHPEPNDKCRAFTSVEGRPSARSFLPHGALRWSSLQIELYGNTRNYPIGVHVLPKHLDEKVARLQRTRLGAELTELTDVQAKYIDVDKQGPYKGALFRY
jgi:hypothetical protein